MSLNLSNRFSLRTANQCSYSASMECRFRSQIAGSALLTIVLGASAVASPQPPDATTPPNPEQLYASACAACHGADGRGAPLSSVAFDVPLPDFSDCSFASREPDGDWAAVVHDGGPVRGFDRMMPAFGEAWGADEILASLDHVRTFCGDESWPAGDLNMPLALITEKAYPEDELVLTSSVDRGDAGRVATRIIYEKRFGARNQIEIDVPFAAVERAPGEWTGGVGDIAVGFKRALLHSADRGSIVSVLGELVVPTGDQSDSLGGGTAVFEPSVLIGQLLPADGFVQVQVGFEVPTDPAAAGREAFWRTAVGKSFTEGAFGRAWTPMLEILGAQEFTSAARPQWDLVPQLQVTLNTRQHVIANVGVRLPVTDADRRGTQVLVYLLWDWFDGGFFEGW